VRISAAPDPSLPSLLKLWPRSKASNSVTVKPKLPSCWPYFCSTVISTHFRKTTAYRVVLGAECPVLTCQSLRADQGSIRRLRAGSRTHGHGTIAAAPSIASLFIAAKASFAWSSGNGVTFGRRPISAAICRKSRASARVMFVTLRI
jgi:hypothetical protein